MSKQITCAHCEKKAVVKRNPLCSKHYWQMQHHGKIITTRFDYEIIQMPDHQVVIKDGKELLFDKGLDLKKIFPSLAFTSHGYVSHKGKYIHRTIMKAPKGTEVDHINHNKLDNRTSNLRVIEPKYNNLNRPKSILNKSGYVGVYFDKRAKKWTAQVQKNRKKHCLPYFDNALDAAIARDKLAVALNGEYASISVGVTK